MKTKLMVLGMTIIFFAAFWLVPLTRTVSAACSCAMECGNRCGFSCSDCNIFTGNCGAEATACCAGAATATGPLPACPTEQ
jgi:hypothetical protein